MAGCWLPALSTEAVAALATYGTEKQIPNGTTLYAYGEVTREAYLVQDGAVRIWCDAPDGPLTIRMATALDFVGMAALFHGKPQCATAEAVTELKVIALTLSDVRRALEERPELRIPLLAVLTEEADVRREKLNCMWRQGGGHCTTDRGNA